MFTPRFQLLKSVIFNPGRSSAANITGTQTRTKQSHSYIQTDRQMDGWTQCLLTSELVPQLGVTKKGGTLHKILKKRVHIVAYGEVNCRPFASLNINVVPKLNSN